MRILGGKWQGRSLGVKLRRGDGIRPMTERVKQALFQILGNVEELRVLDLFAGSGQLGIESLSRGAAFAAFVEIEKQNAAGIRKHLMDLRSGAESARVLEVDVLDYIEKTKSAFDLIFADPPYEKNLVNPCFAAVARHETILAAGGRLVLRHTKHEPLDDPSTHGLARTLALEFSRRYGDDVLTIWRK